MFLPVSVQSSPLHRVLGTPGLSRFLDVLENVLFNFFLQLTQITLAYSMLHSSCENVEMLHIRDYCILWQSTIIAI